MTGTAGNEISFTDSNIWLYALMGGQDPLKYQIAKPLTELPNSVISVQVVNEVCANLIRKALFSESDVQKIIASFYLDCKIIGLDETIFISASDLRGKYHFSYYDSLIVAAALAANATILYSEDMHDGLIVENKLTIVNPF